jgi:hypothetical protein
MRSWSLFRRLAVMGDIDAEHHQTPTYDCEFDPQEAPKANAKVFSGVDQPLSARQQPTPSRVHVATENRLLRETLARILSKQTGMRVNGSDWQGLLDPEALGEQ